jgi:hypothetical protein
MKSPNEVRKEGVFAQFILSGLTLRESLLTYACFFFIIVMR